MPSNLEFEDSIRDEIFSPARLEHYALYLSLELTVSLTKTCGRLLLPCLEENYECLIRAYKKFTASVQKGLAVSPAGSRLLIIFNLLKIR
jgi:hypothetical protein